MVFIVSSLNSCTYTLDPVNHAVLYQAPLLSDGSYETAFSAYDEVIELDEEATRCCKMLSACFLEGGSSKASL